MFIKKRQAFVSMVLILILGLVITACGPAETVEPTQAPAEPVVEPTEPLAEPTEAPPEPTEVPPEPTEEPMKIALIVTAELEDGSWNQFMYESMQVIDEMPEYDVAYSENVGIPDFERVAGDYCRQGYDMILAHTFDYQEPAHKVAEEACSDSVIVGTGFWEFSENVVGMNTWPCESAYVAGVLGGLMTKTNKVGVIGGFAYAPTQVCHHEAYKLGVASVNPDAEISETWTGTWYDVALGYEAASAMIDNGVDFLSISLSGPGFGVIEAAKDHNAAGGDKVYVVGAFVDMNDLAPDTVITSSVWKTTEPTLYLLDLLKEGKLEGKNYEFLMADGGTDMAPYHGLEDEIPQDVKDKVAEVRQQIIDGEIVVPIIQESPTGG
jgi:basic membrane protein A